MKTTDNAGTYDFSKSPFTKVAPPLYNNSDLCGECTGAGCKQCYDPLGLRRLGSETFPLSNLVSGCKPPAIVSYYADKFRRYWVPGKTIDTPHKLRTS